MEINDVPRNTQIQNSADSALLRFDEHNSICPDSSQQEHSVCDQAPQLESVFLRIQSSCTAENSIPLAIAE